MTDDWMPDPLLSDFRRLERDVKRRECEHTERVEVTSVGDLGIQMMCVACGDVEDVER